MPQGDSAMALADKLQRHGCLQVAEVYTAEELNALLHEDPDWQVLIVAPDFASGQIPQDLPNHIEVRFLHAPVS